MALGILMIMFVAMSVISVVGLSLLYLVKGEGTRRVIFYVMAVWGMIVAVISATSLPSNYMAGRLLAWTLGFLSVAGILVYVRGTEESYRRIACLLVTVSVAGGILKLFLF